MEARYFECLYCGDEFISHQKRESHQDECMSSVFIGDDFLITQKQLEKHELSYREMLEQAAKSDPLYRRYVDRINIGEPNDMTLVLKQVRTKERDDRRHAKETKGVRSEPTES
jgi:hypothetical protein